MNILEKANEIIKEGELINPFDKDIHEILQLLSERIKPADGKYIEALEKDNVTPKKFTVYYAPAIILRKRDTRSFTATYEKIISDIELSDNPSIISLDDIIDIMIKDKLNKLSFTF